MAQRAQRAARVAQYLGGGESDTYNLIALSVALVTDLLQYVTGGKYGRHSS